MLDPSQIPAGARGRYVVLHHLASDGAHWDLMFEFGGALMTFRSPIPLSRVGAAPVSIERIGDHRPAYLDYEGPLSGGRGRVARVEQGEYRIETAASDGWIVSLGRFDRRYRFRAMAGQAWLASALDRTAARDSHSGMNLPNQITLARLVLALVFCVMLTMYDARTPQAGISLLKWSFWIFVVAAVSDFVDGYLARRNNQVTSLGRILDPFVDKVLVCGAFILVAGPNFVNADGISVTNMQPWMVVVIVGRELLVSSLRGASEAQGVQYSSNMAGKVKMWVQSITAAWIIHSQVYHPWAWWDVGRVVMIWLTMIITIASMLTYLFDARHVLSDRARA